MHWLEEEGILSMVELTGGRFLATPRIVAFAERREELDDSTCVVKSLGDRSWHDQRLLHEHVSDTLASLSEKLKAFTSVLKRPATLRFTRINGLRRTVDDLGETRERRIDVFALTGQLSLTDGRFMPLGWSGNGDGLSRLTMSKADELETLARATEHAKPVPHGEIAVVLDYQPAAVLAHEAIGHFAEGSAMPEMRLDHRLGCLLAPEWMTAHDDPRLGNAANYAFDDNGIESIGPTVLLKDGRLSAQLHSTVSASRANALPTANARTAQVAQPAIPRLSNLVIGGGNAELDSMIERMNDGLFVRHLSHGFSRGLYVEARLILAERVERGRRTGIFVSGGRVVERTDLFLRAREATRTAELNPNAMCGKHGQILYDVGTIAPAIRMSALRFLS